MQQPLLTPTASLALLTLAARLLPPVVLELCIAMLFPDLIPHRTQRIPQLDNASLKHVQTMQLAAQLPIHAPVVSALRPELKMLHAMRPQILPSADQVLMELGSAVFAIAPQPLLLKDNAFSAPKVLLTQPLV